MIPHDAPANLIQGEGVWCYIQMVKFVVSMLLVAFALRSVAANATDSVSFQKEIAPVLVAKCLGCHNADKAKGGYRLHSFEALLKPGASKDLPVRVGHPDQSLLFKLITAQEEDERMPQKDEALPAADIARLRKWIEQGAQFDGADRSAALVTLSPPEHPIAPRAYPAAIPITALAFDPPGGKLAAAGYHEITIWDSQSGKLLQRIGRVAERTFDLAYSPDGQWLAAASGTPGRIGEVKLFQTTNGELAKILTTTIDAQLCLSFSAAGDRLAAAGADNVIRVWKPASGKLLHSLEQHADWVLALAFSPNGSWLASGSRDKSARVFDMKTGELEQTHSGHGDFVVAIAWADDTNVISLAREKIAHRWNAHQEKKRTEFSGWNEAPTRLVISGGRLFSASLDKKVREHSLESREVIRTFSGAKDALYSLAVHAASKRLAAGAHDGSITVWNMDAEEPAFRFSAAPGFTHKLSRAP